MSAGSVLNLILYFVGGLVTLGLYLLLWDGASGKKKELSGGFASHMGKDYKESDILRILVMEELERYQRLGYGLSVGKTRKKRIILTACGILANFLLLMTRYYRPDTVFWCSGMALAYICLYFWFDPVRELCNAAKSQPDRDISQIVREAVEEQPPKSLKPVAIAAFALSMVLFFAFNATDRFAFAPADGGYSVEKYHPGIFEPSEVSIPESHQGRPVTAIGRNAFEGTMSVSRVTIPKTVTLIDSYAFRDCAWLEQVELPAGLQVLNGVSFKGCKRLQEIVIPEGVESIRGNTFEDCTSLKTVVLHEGIVEIHAYAFRNCKSLEKITLPSRITEIRAYTFENCESLREIEIPEGVTRIAAHAFYNCKALRYVYVPYSVTEIGSSAFRLCPRLTEIELPDGVAVDERAFKESPTKIKKKTFTKEENDQIIQEASEKESEVLYYIYKKENPEAVRGWDKVTVLIVDDIRFAELLDDDEALQAMDSDEEILAYLESAQQAGFTEVLYGIYSPMASEITGELYFVSGSGTVSEMMEECRSSIAEGKHD